MLSTTATTHRELTDQATAQDHTLTLSHAHYKTQIHQITIQQTAQAVQAIQAIQIKHRHEAAILQEHLHVVAVTQPDHRHEAAPTALHLAIPEAHARLLQALTLLQAVAVTAVEALLARAVTVEALAVQVAVRAVVHQVAAEDNRLNKATRDKLFTY